ncbi:DUF7002 family protein [Paraburkholderia sp. ZP32-5]|uniref:DUF7002 family protein n=1 Tax=Paraburkholderia sp. ZP32-5 TaxID=2883245 RepID=UPI001F449F4A|nr:hypothetical protein [Paraburkholderia sp. ZP32-5]
MSPDEFASRYPRLYHITGPEAVAGIRRHGLLATTELLTLFEASSATRQQIVGRIRPASVRISHPVLGSATITDNIPMNERALSACLDDGLSTADWLAILNRRVFFWPDEKSVAIHVGASARRGIDRIVMVFDTTSIAQAHHQQIEVSPINSGSTIRKPARRGLGTFSAIHRYEYGEWQRLRGMRDTIKEITVIGGVRDVERHLLECRDAAGFTQQRCS